MKLYYVNALDAVAPTPSTEASPNLAVNVQKQWLGVTWRTAGIAAENIVFPTGALTPAGAFIAGHNLTASATVKIEGNSSDVWTSPSVSITMTRGEHYYYAFATFTEQAFWRYTIADPTNTNAYLEIGRLWLGVAVEIPVPSKQFTEEIEDTTETTVSLTGAVYGDVGYQYRKMDFAFAVTTAAEKAVLKTYFTTIKMSKPHFINPAVGLESRIEPMYGVLVSNLALRNIKTLLLWGTRLSYREAK